MCLVQNSFLSGLQRHLRSASSLTPVSPQPGTGRASLSRSFSSPLVFHEHPFFRMVDMFVKQVLLWCTFHSLLIIHPGISGARPEIWEGGTTPPPICIPSLTPSFRPFHALICYIFFFLLPCSLQQICPLIPASRSGERCEQFWMKYCSTLYMPCLSWLDAKCHEYICI